MISLQHQYDCNAPTSQELRVQEPIRAVEQIFNQTITGFLKRLDDGTHTGQLIKGNVLKVTSI